VSEAGSQWLGIHNSSRQYLCLPREYAQALGGLRWSDRKDGLEVSTEELVSCEGLAQFLEGFSSYRSLLAFGSMAHWAALFKITSADSQFSRLHDVFQATGANWRNAGALAGMLSETLAAAADPPPADMLCTRLRDQAFPIRWFAGAFNSLANAGEEPAQSPIEFEQHVRIGLLSLADADLSAWLKFGRGPLARQGRELAGVQVAPPLLGGVLDELFQRPRLAAAAGYLPQMVLALAVPPRRLSPEQLPVGGYADVVTHGSIDRLLPSQHALDDLEFLRRYCQNELLFFRREEPPAALRQEVMVVLDQGIRTWGDVRLVLTAAALALAQGADRKSMVNHLAFTSRPRTFEDPLLDADQELGAALEASDFSRNPGLALERVLEQPSSVPRDIFLLTHPLSVEEQDVQSAARRLSSVDRLFALTVSDKGDAELAQLRHGLPVKIRSFHVDFVPASVPAAPTPVAASNWSGAVEAVGWPFRFGVEGPIRLFTFDYSALRLIAVTVGGMIRVWTLNDGTLEILPRPQTQRGRVTDWHALEGVAAGFVLLGVQDSHYVLCHYDCVKRECKVHETVVSTPKCACLSYVFFCHTVVLYEPSTHSPLLALDLATGVISRGHGAGEQAVGEPRFVVNVGREPQEVTESDRHNFRAGQAIRYFLTMGPKTGFVLPIDPKRDATSSSENIKKGAHYFLDDNAALNIIEDGKAWRPFVPYTDGKETFVNPRLQEVRLARSVLAVQYLLPGRIQYNYRHALALFRGPEGNFVYEIPWESHTAEASPVCLSSDGEKLAMLRTDRHLEVRRTDRPERILATVRSGGFGTVSRLWVQHDGFLLSCGRKGYTWHLVQWHKGPLEVSSETSCSLGLPSHHHFRHPRIRDFLRDAKPEEVGSVATGALGNSDRWPKGLVHDGAVFILDRFGQVLVFEGDAVIFQFFAHGDNWTAWLADGARHGRGNVHHWPHTPGALDAMGRALRHATARERL
jgi:hypothetical protein